MEAVLNSSLHISDAEVEPRLIAECVAVRSNGELVLSRRYKLTAEQISAFKGRIKDQDSSSSASLFN